jgi:Ni,Fe-hydrogenase III small subunit
MSILKILAHTIKSGLSRRRFPFRYVSKKTGSRSVFIRNLDAGSCNDCELEISALANPVYDFERFGFHIVASPRHADVLLITGPFTRSMEKPGMAAFDAMPRPRRIVTVGDGFSPDNLFKDSYATIPLPEALAERRVAHIPGDPPNPGQLLDKLIDSTSG